MFSRGRDRDGGRHTRRSRLAAAEAEMDESAIPPIPVPEFGPYDVAVAPARTGEVLDLGALRIPALAGVEIRLQAGPEGQVQKVQLAHGASRLELAAYAAPRTEGIWDEVRASIKSALHAAGARPQDADGDYGAEVRARVKEGSGHTEVRHVGVDGPRWFVHAVYLGTAAGDPERAGPLREALRGLVVDRGTEARPVSEALPLRLPPEAAQQLADARPPESQAT
jgi:hypothetical protein